MVNPSTSSIEDLNAFIRNSNPFDKPLIVKDQHIWNTSFPDVPTLNAHASDAVFKAVKQARSSKSVNSITLVAEPGAGKSHIISRIRHHLPIEDNVLFIYMNKYSDLKLIKCQFQGVLADSFNRFGSKEVTQWQELAAAIVNHAKRRNLSPKKAVEEFNAISLDEIEQLIAVIQATKHNVDPDIVKAILWTLSPGRSSYANKWLAGKDLSTKKADELDLPSKNQGSEAEAFDTTKQILDLISDYYSLIICFDELDGINYADPDQSESAIGGYSQPQVIADFIKDLFNNLTQGTILTVMQSDTWRYSIEGMPNSSAIKARLSSRGDAIFLHPIDEHSIVELVSIWLKDFYAVESLSPPTSIYPFTQTQLKEIAKNKLPAREVLNWCRNYFRAPDPGEEDSSVESLLKKEISKPEITNLTLDDSLLISNVLLNVLREFFINKKIKEVVIKNIVEFKPKTKKKNYINLRIVGEKNGKAIEAGVAIFQDSNQNSAGACLKQLIDLSTSGLTCSCLIRSADRAITGNTARSVLNQLTSTSKGKLISLQIDDLKTLKAIISIYEQSQNDGLSKEKIRACIIDSILKENSIIKNGLIRDIFTFLAMSDC